MMKGRNESAFTTINLKDLKWAWEETQLKSIKTQMQNEVIRVFERGIATVFIIPSREDYWCSWHVGRNTNLKYY